MNKLDSLRHDLAGVFIDASGSSQYSDELFNEIVNAVEERIIKLLESERWTLPNGLPAGGEIYIPLEEAIALIKGENK